LYTAATFLKDAPLEQVFKGYFIENPLSKVFKYSIIVMGEVCHRKFKERFENASIFSPFILRSGVESEFVVFALEPELLALWHA